VFQPIIHFFLALNNQIVLIHDELLTWFTTFSSTMSHALLNFTQTYIQGLFSGLPAAMPRQVADARSQWIRFYRIMTEPKFFRFRNRQKKEAGKKKRK